MSMNTLSKPPYMKIFKHYEQTTSVNMVEALAKSAMLPFVLALGIFLSPEISTSNNLPIVDWLIVDAGPDQNICLGESAQLEATGANSYTWSPSTGLSCTACPNPVATPTVTTMYFVLADDGSTDSVMVSVFTEPEIISVTVNDPTDCNLPNGSIVVEATGGGPLEYSVTGGAAWQPTGVFTALAVGDYQIAVRNVGGACLLEGDEVTLEGPPTPIILDTILTNPTLCDVPNGSIVISTAGGISPLQYSIDGGLTWQSFNTFQLLTSGTYDIRVRNADGSCEISGGEAQLIGSPDEAFISDVLPFPPSNCDLEDGLITILVTNDDGSFEYSIDGGFSFQSTNSFPGLGEGLYHIIVRRIDGSCVTSGGFIELLSNNHPEIFGTSLADPTDCNAEDGNVTILAFGQSTIQFSIDGGVTWQGSNNFPDLSGGDYEIAVQNSDGTCFTDGGTVTLTEPTGPEVVDFSSTDISACGQTDGSITLTADLNSGLEYSVDGGATWQSDNFFQNLTAGSYQSAVRNDDGSCTNLGPEITLTEPDGPGITDVAEVNPSGCGLSDGSLTLTASGAGNLEYSINGGASWQSSNFFSSLGSGTYLTVVRLSGGSCQSMGPMATLEEPDAPEITGVSFTDPSACGVDDGTITIAASGTGTLEYSIDGGVTWSTNSNFTGLPGGSYDILVRQNGTCQVEYILNPIPLTGAGDPPVIDDILLNQPTCAGADGSLTILAGGNGILQYSIDGGTTFQPSAFFGGLSGGNFDVVVSIVGSNCTASSTAALSDAFGCNFDTVQALIQPGVLTDICLPPDVFDFPGFFTSVGFCGQGNVNTVSATTIAGACVTLNPGVGFVGTSPDLICTIHCFNNSTTDCDTTFIQVTVDGVVNCDEVFEDDTVGVNFMGNPTYYCVPVPFSQLTDLDVVFEGQPLTDPFDCDPETKVAYTYGFLPGGGFGGPYTLESWIVNGTILNGLFNDPQGLVDLMNALDPDGEWILDTNGSVVIGGFSGNDYGNMTVLSPGGLQTTLQTNFTPYPTGFTVPLTAIGPHMLTATDPVTGCVDTLIIIAEFDLPGVEVVNLTTSVNTLTDEYCLDGEDLPGGTIVNFGFCETPSNGAAPVVNDSCVFYAPNLNFAGLDTFCVVVCDGGFPQVCDSTIFVVNVLPETDTVFLNIPPGGTEVDTCLDDFVIELPGAIDQASFCGINLNEVTAQIDDNCLTFSPVGGFVGTSEICVEYCSGGICDVTIVFVTVEPPIICDEVFGTDSETIYSIVDTGFYCIPISPGDIVGYDVFLDGNAVTQSFTPCDFGNLLIYNYSALATGPYFLESWSVNGGTTYFGNFPDMQTLVDSMNVWDPTGNWENNLLGLTINGGAPANDYSDIVITEIGVGLFVLEPSDVILPLGSQMLVTGFGAHEVIVTAANGCSDTVAVNLEQHFVTPETLFFETSLNTTVSPICANTSELLGDLLSLNFCGLPANGSVTVVSDSCVSYTPGLNFTGTDEFCLVVCDDNQPQVCDTFFVVVETSLPIDTVFVELDNVTPYDTCLTGDVLQLPGMLDTAFICDVNPAEVAISFLGNCVTIDLEDTFVGTTTACVVHCTPDVPPVCDTTILVISFDGVFPCDPIFDPDEVTVFLVNDTGTVCLPVAPADIGNYDILLDGNAYAGSLFGCDFDLVYTYFYGSVPGQGNVGPYDVEWTANGTFFAGTVQDMAELVDLMNGWDPSGDWVLNPSIFTIEGSNDANTYGELVITNSQGLVTNIPSPILNPIPLGTEVAFTGEGQHEVVLIETGSGCDDTLIINAIDPADVIFISTVEDTPSAEECIDTTGLPGNFVAMTLCDDPENGTFVIDENCFTFIPDPGYVGPDTACVEICDDLGNCEATTVIITVEPFCSQFDFFPDGVQEIEVNDCIDIAAYCVPVVLDSMPNFGVTDNGFPYAGGFVACNGNLTQIELDTGFHEIVFTHLASGCQDTLLANVICEDDSTGCGINALSSLNFTVLNCDSTGEFCLDIPILDISNFVITDNGSSFTGIIDECSTMPLMTGVQLDPGSHELVFEDTVKGCVDTFLVEVNCFDITDTTLNVVVPVGDSLEICLDEFDIPIALIDSLVNICPGQSDGNATYEYDPVTGCLTIFGDVVGQDTFCLKVYIADACIVVTVNVDVVEPCAPLFPSGQLSGSTACALGTGTICLPINEAELGNLVITVNGMQLDEPLEPCSFDSTLVLPYDDLPSMGLLPPYIIEDFTINGAMFTGAFNSAAELADSLNTWDMTGDWAVVFDAGTLETTIQGGDTGNDYGPMAILQTLLGIQDTLLIETRLTVTGYGLEVPVGSSLVTFTDTVTLCSEQVIADMACVDSDVVVDTVLIGEADTFCLDLTELIGDIVSIENVCEGSNGEIVEFELVDSCVIYTGLEPGLDTACFVVCDDMDVCDTTYFFITVLFDMDDSTLVAVNDTVVTGEGQVVAINVLLNDTIVGLNDFFILDEPSNGDAVFLPDGSINYVPDPGYCDEENPDSFTYVICNAVSCDTATVFVFVQCSSLEIFNAFSPNDDEINDFFKITGLQNYPNHRLYVYNRWGNLVLETSNYQSDWYGTWNGKDLPDGTYFYMLDLGEGEKPLKGYVQLIR